MAEEMGSGSGMPGAVASTLHPGEAERAAALNREVVAVHKFFLWLYAGLAVWKILTGIWAAVHGQDGSFGWVGLFILPFGFVHWLAARGAARGKGYAKAISFVVACILLLAFPIGTIVGIYLFAHLGKDWRGEKFWLT